MSSGALTVHLFEQSCLVNNEENGKACEIQEAEDTEPEQAARDFMRSAPHEGEVQQREERRRNKGADHREVEKRCHIAHESGDDDDADKGRDRHPDIEIPSRAMLLFIRRRSASLFTRE